MQTILWHTNMIFLFSLCESYPTLNMKKGENTGFLGDIFVYQRRKVDLDLGLCLMSLKLYLLKYCGTLEQ